MDRSWCAYRPVLCHGAHTQALPMSTEGTVQQLVYIVPDPASRSSACAVSMACELSFVHSCQRQDGAPRGQGG